jgi:hypothetical protein
LLDEWSELVFGVENDLILEIIKCKLALLKKISPCFKENTVSSIKFMEKVIF